jgi:hypothetical protein
MKGKEIFKIAVRTLADFAQRAVDANGITFNDVDWVIPHQANLRIIEAVANRLDIPMSKVLVNIDRYGNTSAATVPTMLDEAVRDGRIKKGQLLHDQQQADVNASLRHGQAAEGAARIAEAAKSGAYPDIYAATPDLMKYAKGAAGGTAQDQEAVLREMVALLANRNDLPSSFGNTVKQAFKDALRESAVQVVPENPSRKLTGKAEESGEGRS